jgi:hypothetical protein
MASESRDICTEIKNEADSLLSPLQSAGWVIASSEYDAEVMGSWNVELVQGKHSLRLVKDRSQFYLNGPSIESLQAVGLSGVFTAFAEFRRAVLKWVVGSSRV